MSNIKWLIVLCLTVLCSQHLYAQPQYLSIEEIFRLADQNSQSIQTYQTGREIADEALKAAKTQRLPDLNTAISGSYWGNGKLWDRTFGNSTKIDMPHWGNNFALEAQQVIYAGGAVNTGIKIAELGKDLADLDWQKNRQEIRFLLTGEYLDLYKLDNQIIILQKNLELTEQVIANMIARRAEGTVLQNDITRYELQREQIHLQLTRVKDARKITNHQLVTTLHLPENTEIQPDTTLLNQQIQLLNEENWQQIANENNIHLQQAKTAIKLNEQKVKIERSERLPHIIFTATDHLDGPITIEVPVLNNNFNYWYIGVGIQYNIFSLFKNSNKLKQAKLNIRQAEENYSLSQEQVENAVQAGYINFLTAFTDLQTQEKSIKLANENYAVTFNRYQNEMALLTDMLDASNMKLSADLDWINAKINVIYNYYKMKYITNTL